MAVGQGIGGWLFWVKFFLRRFLLSFRVRLQAGEGIFLGKTVLFKKSPNCSLRKTTLVKAAGLSQTAPAKVVILNEQSE